MEKQYKIILADPPWAYKNKNTGGSMRSGAQSKYPTMTVDNICRLDVQSIADKNCILFLWTTTPLLPEGFQVLRAWGFEYKTMITWHKIRRLGLGYWFRGQTEHLLVGVRGRMKAFRCQEPNILQLPPLRHSEKPEEIRQLIERATKGMGPRIELFARRRADKWDAWGNEVESDICLDMRDGVASVTNQCKSKGVRIANYDPNKNSVKGGNHRPLGKTIICTDGVRKRKSKIKDDYQIVLAENEGK